MDAETPQEIRLPRVLFVDALAEVDHKPHPHILREDFEWVPGQTCVAVVVPMSQRFLFIAELALAMYRQELLDLLTPVMKGARWDAPGRCLYFPRVQFDDSADSPSGG